MAIPEGLKLLDFSGEWTIDRHIAAKGSHDAAFSGHAVWRPGADGARYKEQGQLSILGQQPLHAEREYFWTPDLKVFFPDGRFFHDVLTDGSECLHWCDPDTYKGRYDFSKWPVFTVAWDVSGPRKSYHSITTYRRR